MRVTQWTGVFVSQLGVIPGCIIPTLYNFSQMIMKGKAHCQILYPDNEWYTEHQQSADGDFISAG